MAFADLSTLSIPVVQAPMAGVSTPQMAAAVSDAGALGSIAVGATNAEGAAAMIADVRDRTDRAFNLNLFVHAEPRRDADREAAWLAALDPVFRLYSPTPPSALSSLYDSFAGNDAMLRLLVQTAPPVVSFHFGLPGVTQVRALKATGCFLIATATCLDEATAAKRAGMDAVVAQGYEAGGHRGLFDPGAEDARLGTLALTRQLVLGCGLPVIAAGGIMDGQGVRAVLDRGAVAAQLGTAFIACPESAADTAYRAALNSDAARHTVMTTAISGRPARCLRNRFTSWGQTATTPVPDYPVAYDAGKALNAAAKARGEYGFGAQWAGQGAPLSRAMPAADLVRLLDRERRAA
ncbi:MAG: NAD(P)H-dependent flavin oxidoreductase [Brevundimonas sp.]|uniref:NAD(P)H-dependent flavin oxidoreductase n=1 Tax=Brevundimonas sp. TaxID=1871086 RepID=UPI0028D0121B|nr:nitronate monooxygenase [uncultured Brevundimonas sp.]